MKYYIGASIPKSYKTKIEMVRAEFKFFSTEPHITLIAPPELPDDDSFIKNVLEICKETESFNIKLGGLSQFDERVSYISVISPELELLHDKISDTLGLKNYGRIFKPHLTIAKKRAGRPIDFKKIKERAEEKLIPPPEFHLNSIIVYMQPKERSIYIPYMKLPFRDRFSH